ncbi:MAG: DUF262 domain-containing protein [Gammaproteobacteria bacterium]|nr:MAG: DUF262 domain-containing protein [Gammaproteobacteria bacterium]RKZ41631.1 MAG: DUF262 domain-containing protein [Gammaproteobacteria bacterium]RKZ73444.1 MAG: DUF262 domain-containing protein [Gammaproteobacteria bacterium]
MMQNDELMEIEKEEVGEFDVASEDTDSPFKPKDIDIAIEQNSLSTIIGMIEDDAIDMNTEFQRSGNLWAESVMSRLIESILLRLPLPVFYFDASDDNRWLIVDGLQRLSTFKRFMIDHNLTLDGLEILTDLNGKTYEQLSHLLKRKMARYQVTTYLIKPGTPKRVKYDIFRRINTGGLILTTQEIRHVLNQGKSTSYLNKLVEDSRFTKIIRLKDNRMQARELIVRYLAFSMTPYQEYYQEFKGANFTVFLDKAMEKLAHLSPAKQEQFKSNLWKALRVCHALFGEHIFSKSILDGHKRQNGALFEVWTVLIGQLSHSENKRLLSSKSQLIKEFKSLLKNDDDFFKSVSRSTLSKNLVIKRFETIESLIKKYTL